MRIGKSHAILFLCVVFSGEVSASWPVATELSGIDAVRVWIHLYPIGRDSREEFAHLEKNLQSKIDERLLAAGVQLSGEAVVDLNLEVKFDSVQKEVATAMAFFLGVCDEATLVREPDIKLSRGCAVTWFRTVLEVAESSEFEIVLEDTAIELIDSFVGAWKGAQAFDLDRLRLERGGLNPPLPDGCR
jgi:hypothetical protein